VTATAELVFRPLELERVHALLLDADGNLFPSEEPAYAASTQVINRLLETLGSGLKLDAGELRQASTGKSFRSTAAELVHESGGKLAPEVLEHWVTEEKRAVSRHLAGALKPNVSVLHALRMLAGRYELAVVSSSALSRLDVCFAATGLSDLLPPGRRFSAEDSLPHPASKPDPAVYLEAATRLGISPDRGLAVEDSATGVVAAVAAGFETVGNICFVRESERDARVVELKAAGACAVVSSWESIERLLLPSTTAFTGRER
jgi:beta-phosphoglucomutase-like phosphatase (HAD superfamily)